MSKFCSYHRAYGHETNSCWNLQDVIESMVKAGQLHFDQNAQAQAPPPQNPNMGILTNPLPNHEAKGSGGGSNQVNTILGLEETPVNPAKTIRRDPSIVLGTSFSQPDVFIERRLFFQPGVSNKPICSRMDFSKSAVRDEESSSVNYFNSQGGSSQSVHPWTGPPLVIHVGKTSSSQPLDWEASSNPIPSSGIVPQLTVAASSSPAAHSPSIISLGQGAPFHQTSPSQMTQFQSATSSGRGAPLQQASPSQVAQFQSTSTPGQGAPLQQPSFQSTHLGSLQSLGSL